MTVPFVLIDTFDFDRHHFRVYEPGDSSNSDWLSPLAQEYIKLLTHRETALRKIVVNQNDLQMDVSHIQKYLRKASIPRYKAGNFNVVRSDFGELLCYMLLERDYGTSFGAKSICHRELRDLPGRGIDAIGVECDSNGLLTADFGSFRKTPGKYDPATIRFLIACIPDTTDVIIKAWYDVVEKTEVPV
ncbi:MAG: hypothetical protein H0W02_00475 [Ktedonobacteraceae bacterium]|nr:hypothetical protein [Ktedonobacteraceae bacterium]